MLASTPVLNQQIAATATLRDAMQKIDSSSIKLAIVVDADGRLTRTVTDGDVRRGLLAGLNLQSAVGELPGRNPVIAHVDMNSEAVAQLLDDQGVQAVVVVDNAMVPVRLVDRTGLAGMTLMSPPHIGQREIEYVRAAFEDNWIAPSGPNLALFEERLAEVSSRAHALVVSSGTAAIHLALRCLGVGAGDRIYVSDLTFVASVQPILYEKAVPVLIDSEPDGWNMSPLALQRRLAADSARGMLPKAIVVVHIYGQSADLRSLGRIAESFGVPIVEDAAESLGASYYNRPSGSHGLLSAFSFNGNKIITTSGGGALVSDDGALIDYARYLSTQGRDGVEHYQHSDVAYNYRMSNVLAGIGVGQLELLAERVSTRRAIFRRYHDGLKDIPGIRFQSETAGSAGNRWLTVIALDPDLIAVHPYKIMRDLRQSGIETRPGWKPMHMQPLLAGYDFEPHDEVQAASSQLFLQSLCLPSGSSLHADEQDRIIDRLRKLCEKA